MTCDNTKKHHYVPQGILKNFSTKRNIWWYSKKSHKQKKQNIKKVANKKHFYRYPETNKSLEIDFFNQIDSDTPKVIEKIINEKSIHVLTDDDLNKLLKYIASQASRTPRELNSIDKFEKLIKEQVHNDITILNKDLKSDYLDSIIHNTELRKEILKKKAIFLHEAENGERFIIGDSPILSFNQNKEKINVIHHVFPPVIDFDMYFLPVSENLLLILFNDSLSLNNEINFYIKKHNIFQIINSVEWVFSKEEKTLISEIEKYNDYCYEVVKIYNPDLIKNGYIKKGDVIDIESPIYKLEESLKVNLRDKYIESLMK